MADQLKEFAELPRDFLKDGTQFLNRCTKRTYLRSILLCDHQFNKGPTDCIPDRVLAQNDKALSSLSLCHFVLVFLALADPGTRKMHRLVADPFLPADKREFLKISQAVGVGFLVMGTIGYIVKLSTCCLVSSFTRSDLSWRNEQLGGLRLQEVFCEA